jgi:uncharacterized membrane protein
MNSLFAHSGSGIAGNGFLTAWEIHPILIHFPIAFLIGGVLVSAWARYRGRLDWERAATNLFLAGILTGLLAAAAGLLAFFTVPETHTELAHQLMYWHLGLVAGALVLFIVVTISRWSGQAMPSRSSHVLMWVAAAIFVVGAAVGGHIVYHGGAGIEPDLMKSGIHGEHDDHQP